MADGVKTDEINFESLRENVQELSLRLFTDLSGGSIERINRHLLFKEILALVFASFVREYAQRRIPQIGEPTVHIKAQDGLSSLSLIKREAAVVRKLKQTFGSKLNSALDTLRERVTDLLDRSMPVEYLGMLFETMYGAIPDLVSADRNTLLSSHERRDKGVYFTPPEVVRFLTRTTLQHTLVETTNASDLLRIRIIDPALGAGFFLLESLRLLSQRFVELSKHGNLLLARRLVAEHSLYGIDIDLMATDIAKALIWLEVGDVKFSGADLDKHIKHGDALLGLPLDALGPSETIKNSSKSVRGIGNLLKLHDAQFCNLVTKNGSDSDAIAARPYRPFSWELNFPEVFLTSQELRGFDIVLSNPPWGKVKPDLKEFYSHLDESVSQYQGEALRRYVNGESREFQAETVNRLWRQYAGQVQCYAAMLQELDVFQHQRIELNGRTTRGDSDLYKYFMERCFQVLKNTGRLGLVVPAAFHRSEGAAGVRRLYWGKGRFETFLEFENKKNIFPIHGMFRFVLLTYQRGGRPGIQSASFGLTSIKDAETIQFSKRVRISASFLKRVGGDSLTVPEVRSKLEQRLLSKLYGAHPILGNRSSQYWNVSFVRELDMTKDSGAFRDRAQLLQQRCIENEDRSWSSKNGIKYLPLYEGRMVNQFDNAAKAYKGGQGRTAQWVPLSFTNKAIVPHYFVADSYIEKYDLVEAPARAGFCDVTGHANERTVLSALIPKGIPCGNKVPTLLFDNDDPKLHLIWLALANSFVIDWLVRRRISTTLNFFHWYSIPFPRITPNSMVGRELSEAAAKLCRIEKTYPANTPTGKHHKDVLKNRSGVRAQIDAIVAELFELTLTEYVLILSDFQIIDRCQPPLKKVEPVETRSTITRDKALSAFFERKKQQAPSDILNRIIAAESHGAVAYVPSEHAAIA